MLDKTSYVLRVDKSPGWQKYRRAATLAMCPGNENWAGEKFLTVLEWAARHFDFVRVDLSDTLNRHNFIASGMDEETALNQSKVEGDVWVRMHGQFLVDSGKPFEIVRWDRWRLMPEFPALRDKIAAALDNTKFATAFAADIETYRTRIIARGKNPGSTFSLHGRNYLLEELACITLQAIALPESSRLYPAAEPRSSQLLRSGAIDGLPDLAKEFYLAFNLRHRKSGFMSDQQSADFSSPPKVRAFPPS